MEESEEEKEGNDGATEVGRSLDCVSIGEKVETMLVGTTGGTVGGTVSGTAGGTVGGTAGGTVGRTAGAPGRGNGAALGRGC